VDVNTNTVIAAEALSRWNHPQLGFLLPNEFIPVIEDSEIFFEFCDWATKTACAQNKKWQDLGMAPIKVAVNVSVRQLAHSQFVPKLKKILEETGLNPNYLELEITETAAMQNIEHNFQTLRRLKDMGINITIDDFGIGHSSLSYLKNFPIDTIKIDKSFIKDSITHKEDLAIIKAILTLAEGLRLSVVAEGVETEEQLHHLLNLNCRYVQGFLFSMAVPADTFFENYRNNFLI
jgi:EAL domain-containing protein (putative c-di-GMP-specific phosphodiesterase class I)